MMSYDGAGQLLEKWDSSGVRVTYTGARPERSRGDANGNTLQESNNNTFTTTYAWDYENRLVEADMVQGTTFTITTLSYYGDGKRQSYGDQSPTTPWRAFVWDGENVLVERQANGDNVRDYTYHPQGYGALLSESGLVYHHGACPERSRRDGLGSTDRTTDASGTVESHFLYHAFGEEEEVLTTAAGETRYRWLGEIGYYWQPSTSHYWVRASVYNDTNGRWLKRDPLQQTNPYRYVGNNPLSMVDPSGLQPYGPHGNPMLCSRALNYERCMQHHRAMWGGGGGGSGGRYQEPWWERARGWYMGGMGGASDWLDWVLMGGATANFGNAVGSGASNWEIFKAGANWGVRLGWNAWSAGEGLASVNRATAMGGRVTRWGPEGKWVITGERTLLNYWASGAKELELRNPDLYPFSGGRTWPVMKGALRYPIAEEGRILGVIKGVLGQRVLR